MRERLLHNAKASGILPWSDDLFRICLFGLSPDKDVITPALNNAVLRALNASSPEELRESGEELRALMDVGKEQTARQFSDVLKAWRSEGPLPEEEHRNIFARSIARQAGIDEGKVDVTFVVNNLNALYEFEKTKIQIAAHNSQYNVGKHSNDIYDAELLIYLADPTLHLLTCDKGFRRIATSSQYDRVHIAEADCLRDSACAEQAIRAIAGAITR